MDIANQQTSQSFCAEILQAIPVAIVVINHQGIVTQANKIAEDLLAKPLYGELWIDIIKRAFAPREDDGHEISLRSGRRVSISIASTESGKAEVISLTDLTETRALQEQKSQHTHLLKMGKMTAELAHQIRTPLASAMLYTSHLKSIFNKQSKAEATVEKIAKNLNNIERQINDMLVYAKGGSSVLETVAIAELIADVQVLTQSLLQRKNITLIVNNKVEALNIKCHKNSLLGAMQNLIDNAVDASDIKAVVTLIIAYQQDKLAISVVDNGCGINKEKLSEVTKPFVTYKTNGTGLGLSVVDAVARAHGGHIEINSIEGSGTTISLILPIL